MARTSRLANDYIQAYHGLPLAQEIASL